MEDLDMALKRLLLCLSLLLATASYAQDTLLLDSVEMDRQSASLRPARGIDMTRVEANFGSPIERHAAVGEPPISRWDYPGFSVYFEHSIVLHTVVRR
jgi:hypothetical protein